MRKLGEISVIDVIRRLGRENDWRQPTIEDVRPGIVFWVVNFTNPKELLDNGQPLTCWPDGPYDYPIARVESFDGTHIVLRTLDVHWKVTLQDIVNSKLTVLDNRETNSFCLSIFLTRTS